MSKLPPLTGTDRFSVLVPLVPTNVNAPIAIGENPLDPHQDFYAQLLSLAIRPDKPQQGWPTPKPRNFSDQEASFKFVTRLVQYYVFEALDRLRRGQQGTKWIGGVGVIPINKNPVPVPQSVSYPFAQIEEILGDNEFFGAADKMIWKSHPMCFPVGTSVVISGEDEIGKPFIATITLERKDHFNIVFTIRPLASMAQLPAGFGNSIQKVSVETYNISITTNYAIQQRHDTEFNPQEYVAWANALSSGLKDLTGFN
ncbi:MAG: hypothetical protein ACYDBH_03450 [Acidobacteriaceae bacterium]